MILSKKTRGQILACPRPSRGAGSRGLRITLSLSLHLYLACQSLFSGPPALNQREDIERLSPRTIHTSVRQAILEGDNVSDFVEAWSRNRRDYSFDSFQLIRSEIVEATRLESQARRLWKSGQHEPASRLYQTAEGLLRKAGAASEAAFMVYYQAEIRAEQERYIESLHLLESAYQLAKGSRPRPYLEALLFQSEGYNLWMMDYLRLSMQAFSQAQIRFARTGLAEGIVTSWSNLALLYDELEMPNRAKSCYEKALAHLSSEIDGEIHFQLRVNFALHLHRRGDSARAQAQLELARHFSEAASFDLLLLETWFSQDPAHIQRLQRAAPPTLSHRIQRELVLAELEADPEAARDRFVRTLDLSEDVEFAFLRRQVVREYGSWLESQGLFSAAEKLYSSFLTAVESLEPEYLFPYSRAHASHFRGWIRCLVELEQWDEAHQLIQKDAEERRVRALRLVSSPPTLQRNRTQLEQYTESNGPDLDNPPASTSKTTKKANPAFATLEMWPDRDRIYTWLSTPQQNRKETLFLTEPVAELVEQVLEPFFNADSWLPPEPDPARLHQLYRQLFQPFEDDLNTSSVLLIPHRELQALPFELLLDGDGRFLGEHYVFSYLPSQTTMVSLALEKKPLLVLPETFPSQEKLEEGFFGRIFPEALVTNRLADLQPAHWIHISSHFQLEKDFWLGSAFESGSERLEITDLLHRDIRCNLMSLGACDLGNSYSWGTPYFMGAAELLLARGARSLLVSRWKLESVSMEIYHQFFRKVRDGYTLDQALFDARREFLDGSIFRNGRKIPVSHPFFWAGVTYIGHPGLRLYQPGPPLWLPACLVLPLLASIILMPRWLRALKRSRSGLSSNCHPNR